MKAQYHKSTRTGAPRAVLFATLLSPAMHLRRPLLFRIRLFPRLPASVASIVPLLSSPRYFNILDGPDDLDDRFPSEDDVGGFKLLV
jgi:hypothetical protein